MRWNFIINDENPIWWYLGRIVQIRIRESKILKTVLELYDLEIHQKKAGPDYHRLTTMVKKSIEQDSRNKNFGARNGNYERNAVVKNQRTKQRGQRILGDCWQWETNGQWKETMAVSVTISINVQKWHSRIRLRIVSCSRMKENHREPEVPEDRVPVVEFLDGHGRITSKELAPIHSVKSGTLQSACSTSPRVVADLAKSARMHIVRLMNNLVKGPIRMMTKVQLPCWRKYELHDRTGQIVVDRDTRHESNHGPVGRRSSNARQLGCVFQDMEPPKLTSILRKAQTCRNQSNVWNSRKLLHVTIKFETKIHRLEWFAQVILISVAPTLQNLRNGLGRRKIDKSKVPAKQRGSWPKVCEK